MARPKLAAGMPGVRSLVVSLAGVAAGAFAAVSWKLAMPATGKIVAIDLNVGARGGTHVTSSLDVLAAATSLLTAVFDVDALTPGTPVSKTGTGLSAAAASVAMGTALVITAAESGGTNPTISATTVQIDYIPTGD